MGRRIHERNRLWVNSSFIVQEIDGGYLKCEVLNGQTSQPDESRTCFETNILPSLFTNCRSVLVKAPIIC